jgi:hypothetical protein
MKSKNILFQKSLIYNIYYNNLGLMEIIPQSRLI